jgi:hypothetical protein
VSNHESDHDDPGNAQDSEGSNLDDMLPNMSEDRPLDALVPEMSQDQSDVGAGEDAPSELEPIHPRVLEVTLEEGQEWTMACWQDPGPLDLGDQLGRLLRATLLRTFSRPPTELAEDSASYTGIRLLAFDSLGPDSQQRLEELGFVKDQYRPDHYQERIKAWIQEADAAGHRAGQPESIWHLPLREPTDPGLDSLEEVATAAARHMDGQVWGETPGAASRHVARELEGRFDTDLSLGLDSLDTFEQLLFSPEGSGLRWTPPMLFQGLCDFVGVVLHGRYNVRVQWGLCEAGASGIIPPPTFRLPRGDHHQTIPIAQRLTDWIVLPIDEGDARPPLSERIDQLARLVSDN